MPKKVSLTISSASREPEDFEFEFSDEEWKKLLAYAERVDKLDESPATGALLRAGFSVEYTADGGFAPVDTSRFPSDDELAAFLHRFRPIILSKEPYSFEKTLAVVSKKAPSKVWKAVRGAFDGTHVVDKFTIKLTPAASTDNPTPAPVVLNSEGVFKLWLNGFEYHEDEDKAASIENLYSEAFPSPEHVKGMMLYLLQEKAKAAAQLRQIVRVFDLGPGASYSKSGGAKAPDDT